MSFNSPNGAHHKGYTQQCNRDRTHKKGKHFVKEVWGKGWRTIAEFGKREDALEELENQLLNRDAQWSREIKMIAGWVCQVEGCGIGVGDPELLESHHIKPKEQFPEFRHDLSNGECLCIYHHAMAHKNRVREIILARYALILHKRYFG